MSRHKREIVTDLMPSFQRSRSPVVPGSISTLTGDLSSPCVTRRETRPHWTLSMLASEMIETSFRQFAAQQNAAIEQAFDNGAIFSARD